MNHLRISENMTSVLIVDDAAFSRRMLRKYVEAEGCDVIEAKSGKEAIALITEQHPDYILTDLLMPDIDGFELLQTLQELKITIPTVIISADIQDTSRERGKTLGASGFINKPAKETEVRQTLRHLIDSSGVPPL
jgi:CheY-like chemotaxis protein